MMSNYDDEQSEDGELAQSPLQEEMDFSLSDDDQDNLVIKPPQAIIRPSHRERRGHKKVGKEKHREFSRKEKKHLYRDREKPEKVKVKNQEQEDMNKEAYREKAYYREMYREKEMREKELYRADKEVYHDKEVYRDKEVTRERDVYRDKDAYRERANFRDRDMYREGASHRDMSRPREVYREKEQFKEKDVQRDRETYTNRDRQGKFMEVDRKQRGDIDRLRVLIDEGHSTMHNEKENRTTGDKELEDLRSRLLSKRISKELQETKKYPEYADKNNKNDRQSIVDKHQQERRKKLIEAEREMEKRKNESRTELEARREERRRRGKKRAVSPVNNASNNKKNRNSPFEEEEFVTVSDSSDMEAKSTSPHSEPEEGEHSKTESDDDSSSTESESDGSKTEGEDDDEKESEHEKSGGENVDNVIQKEKITSPMQENRSLSKLRTPKSNSRSKSRSRSRSHSFSPPPPDENGKMVEEHINTEEETKVLEEKINLLPPYFPALQGCRSVEEFHCLNRIEEGTYGVVYRARDRTTEEIVALKRLKMEKEKEGFPITSLREINTLLKGQHPNIVTVREIVVGSNMDKIFIVMDYVEHDLKSLMETMRGKKQVFLPGEIKCLMTQLLRAVHHLHDNWILHRDLKTSNLLLSHKGVLKVGDFGLAREYGSPLRQYTPVVVTLWYRAPELLLCCKEYSTHIDMWSVGCIFAEFVTMNPLFPGKSEVDQLNRIFKDLGTPTETVWPGYSNLPAVQNMTFADHPPGKLRTRAGPDVLSETGLALLQSFLNYDPTRRISADAALEHNYFKEMPQAIEPAMFPTWPAKSEGGRRTTHSPRPPAGGAQHVRSDEDDALGFHVRSLPVAPGFSLKF